MKSLVPPLTFLMSLLLLSSSVLALPPVPGLSKKNKISVTNNCFIGLTKGVYEAVELGAGVVRTAKKERRYVTNALNFSFNYNYREDLLGYTMSYWRKSRLFGLTYGLDAIAHSDFKTLQWGGAPVIGVRIWRFHVQTGYQIIYQPVEEIPYNTFFVRARFSFKSESSDK